MRRIFSWVYGSYQKGIEILRRRYNKTWSMTEHKLSYSERAIRDHRRRHRIETIKDYTVYLSIGIPVAVLVTLALLFLSLVLVDTLNLKEFFCGCKE